VPTRRALGLLLAALALTAAAPRAAAETPLRAVVRVDGADDEALLQRLRGQVSDLGAALVVERGPLEPRLAGQLDRGAALARAHGAPVVVWFLHPGPRDAVVLVAVPASERVLVRRVAAGRRAGDRSAMLEAAAVIVRGALRALAAGGRIGIATEAAVRQLEDREPAPVAGLPVAGPPPPPAPAPRRAALGWRAAVGWQVAGDGASPYAQQGIAARLALERGRLLLELAAWAGLPSRLDDGQTTVELTRHAGGLAAGWAVVRGEHLRLVLGAWLGAAAYFRSTAVTAAGVAATPSRASAAFVAGPEARLQWSWRVGQGAVGLELFAGCDAVAGVPDLVYQQAAATVPRTRLWPVQPRGGLSLVVGTP
jgi:hypothetical protein